ncbi:hypothetical protein [Paludibaculum fermentans]|uniref:hypothetical protein n=1 Tax=Paludibaculum fermentans TaxID=1473598 RepID=UPI003EC04415
MSALTIPDSRLVLLTGRLLILIASAGCCLAQTDSPLGWDPHLTFAGNFDAGYHKTQFFEENHNVAVGQWDSRVEWWLYPNRKHFAWGPYLRLSGIMASKSEAWENAWLGGPGVGLQVYPFDIRRGSSSPWVKVFGPTRVFAEYNRLDYWGAENRWRPHKETRFGAEYWRSLRVNNTESSWWAETWHGLWRQSANEFTPTYRSWIFANALRSGIRASQKGALSAITPYGALESSLTDNQTYYWENRLLVGGGVRFAPSLRGRLQDVTRINRFAIYGEYLHIGAYYRDRAPVSTPNYEVRIGVTFSTGLWYW